MRTEKVNNKETTKIGEETLSLEKYQKLKLINYAAYALTTASEGNKNNGILKEALVYFKDWNVADISDDEIIMPDTASTFHKYYIHRGWNYDYAIEGLAEEKESELWVNFTPQQQKEIETHLLNAQKRFNLGKNILLKSVKLFFPSFSKKETDALACLCYYRDIYRNLKKNINTHYSIYLEQFRNDLITALEDLTSIKQNEEQKIMIERIKTELPDTIKFTVPLGRKTPFSEWNHLGYFDRVMEIVREYFHF